MQIKTKRENITEINDFQRKILEKLSERFNLHNIDIDESPVWGHVAILQSHDPFYRGLFRLTRDDLCFFSELSLIRWVEIDQSKLLVGL